MRVRPKQILYLNNKQELQFVELCVAGTGPYRISCHPQASYSVGLLHFYRQGSQGSEVLSDSSVAIVLGSGRATIQIQVSLAAKLMPWTVPLYCP